VSVVNKTTARAGGESDYIRSQLSTSKSVDYQSATADTCSDDGDAWRPPLVVCELPHLAGSAPNDDQSPSTCIDGGAARAGIIRWQRAASDYIRSQLSTSSLSRSIINQSV